jgi:hypothetical protein
MESRTGKCGQKRKNYVPCGEIARKLSDKLRKHQKNYSLGSKSMGKGGKWSRNRSIERDAFFHEDLDREKSENHRKI